MPNGFFDRRRLEQPDRRNPRPLVPGTGQRPGDRMLLSAKKPPSSRELTHEHGNHDDARRAESAKLGFSVGGEYK